MDCDGAIFLLAAREQRTLTDLEEAGLRGHLEGCDECREVAAHSNPAIDKTLVAGDAPGTDGELIRGGTIGGFLVLGVLGSGGMGVVYSAYDPDLDRKVAIKLLRESTVRSENGRTRLLREAQAMARIKHPNVIKVYEVGTYGEHVYVAMELADGGTLRGWLAETKRGRREILAVYAQAGRGLAAAHAAGLVHRDFKPDNVLMGKDGSVLVTDFGLVGTLDAESTPPAHPVTTRTTPLSEDLTHTGAVMGTPAYMAPEQFEGRSSAPSDQFAFCVALYEALYGERPFRGGSYVELATEVLRGEIEPPPPSSEVPGWLRRVLIRGLAVEPAARYPTMTDLVDALGHDAVRARRGVTAGVVALGLAGVAVTLVARSGSTDACSDDARERISEVWNPTRSAAMKRAFDASARHHAGTSYVKTAALVDDWSRGWESGFVQACHDTRVRGEQSETLFDRRVACLTRRLDDGRATLDALIAGGDDAVDHALDAAGSLPAVAPCADRAGLLADVPPPDLATVAAEVAGIRSQLDEARGEWRLGRFAKAMAIARPALDRSRTAGYPPVTGEALALVGLLQHELGDRAGAATLDEAMRVSAEAGDGRGVVEAAGWLLLALGADVARFDAGEEVVNFAEATARHVHPPAEIAARLDISAGFLLELRGRPDARTYFEHALDVAEHQLGADHPTTLDALEHLGRTAKTHGRFADAQALLERVVASRERVAGTEHPSYARALNGLGDVYRAEGKLDDAQRLYDRALAIRTAALGPDHPDVGSSFNSLGQLALERGDYATARRDFEHALAIAETAYGADSIQIVPALSNLGIALQNQGDAETARHTYERVLALDERAHGPDHPSLVAPLTNLGVVANNAKRYDDARALFDRALGITERVYGPEHPDVADALTNIATVLKHQDRLDEAEAMTLRALEATRKAYGADHTRVAMGLTNLGQLQEDRKHFADALKSFAESVTMFEAKLGKDHAYLSYPLGGMGQTLLAMNRPGDAVGPLERALAIRIATKMPPGPVAELRFWHAKALAADPQTRARARSEAEAAIADYTKAGLDYDVTMVRDWLAAH